LNQWPNYACELATSNYNATEVRLPGGLQQAIAWYPGRWAPGSFLWGKEIWNTCEREINVVINYNVQDGVVQFLFNRFLRGYTADYAVKVGSMFLMFQQQQQTKDSVYNAFIVMNRSQYTNYLRELKEI
jgi:hypothetical protein